mmetsp:Transcript_27525/g.49626  ORF Transcript_27525/g.49626 Transcript_27525/m.49626 type:complete len:418 (-) Transcript_27525:3398-4651(-)|eukprot:CAMPEP_0204910944 /NCGR_PEP_ID=MMETSP1397-20131031/9375_1 /ASSEMBLY_ACC=CAM_ASM_000891 /TAXON_ID=49980 /ORGANISM="Climacostomum Climacostomum virens, Strain Stock W-24" /LENGTH=417 /DNA_ID=CAMNT_0052081301 /DNA_START=296 /DNA_END=1549 /DNA_ORIENTATION=+
MMEEKEVVLRQGCEVRIELLFEQELKVFLESGKAERFGEELPLGTWITFPGPANFAIYSWHGCTLKLKGYYSNIYVYNTEVTMKDYLLTHGRINRLRYERCRDRQVGPRVLVVGGASCGKTALCKILTNYALKCGWRPIYVDLDVTNNLVFHTGCIAAASMSHKLWEPSLAYFYGHNSPQAQPALFKSLITELASATLTRLSRELQYAAENFPQSYSPKVCSFASGCIIDFPPFLNLESAEDVMHHVIDKFQVDVVLVIDQERLIASLQHRGIEPISLYQLGGVVTHEQEYRMKVLSHSLNAYFARFTMHQLTLSFDEIVVYKVTCSSTPLSALTYGATPLLEGFIVVQVAPTQETLLHSLLGVLADQDVLKSSILGIVHVCEVDETRRVIKVLATGELPSKRFIIGSIKRLKERSL